VQLEEQAFANKISEVYHRLVLCLDCVLAGKLHYILLVLGNDIQELSHTFDVQATNRKGVVSRHRVA
jgi:hypothetical protein